MNTADAEAAFDLKPSESVSNILDRYRNATTPLDEEIREMAIAALANDFLNVPEMSLDVRAYMVETTLPTLVLALERLLKEVGKRGMTEMPEPSTAEPKNPGKVEESWTPSREADIGQKGGMMARAAEEYGVQADKPPDTSFDAVNWLAQYLYRNNPRFSNFSSSTSSPYLRSIHSVSETLKQRLYELEQLKLARIRAEENQRRLEQERAEQARAAQIAERRRAFGELLSTKEMEDAYRAVFSSDAVQSDPDMLQKIAEILKGVTNSPSAQATPATASTTTTNAPATPTTTMRPTSERGREYEKWDQDRYISTHLQMTDQWTTEEVTFFLQQLGTIVDQKGDALKQAFDESFFMPHFKELPADATRDDWVARLRETVEAFDVGEEGLPEGAGQAKDLCLRFCDGSLGELMAASVGIARSSSRRSTSISGPVGGGAGGGGAETKLGAFDAETEYKQFARVLIGDVGADSFRSLMDFLRQKLGTDEDKTQELENPVLATVVEAPFAAHKDPRQADMAMARTTMAGSLYDMLARADQMGIVSIQLINRLLEEAVASSEQPDAIKNILNNLKFTELPDVENGGTIPREDFVARYVNVWAPLNEDELAALFPVLSFAFGRATIGKAVPHTVGGGEPLPEGAPMPVHEIATTKTHISTEQRAEIEQAALTAISTLTSEMDMNIAAACRAALDSIAHALGRLHPNHDIRGRVSLTETSVTKTTETNADGTVVSVTSEQKFYRTVAGTSDMEQVIGKTVAEGHGLEGEVVSGGKSVVVSDVRKHEAAAGVDIFATTDRDQAVDRYVGVPIKATPERTIGAMQLNMLGDEEEFITEDVRFIEKAVDLFTKTLDDIDSRDKAIILANAAKHWAVQQGDVEVEMFLPHPQSGIIQDLYKLVDVSKEEKDLARSKDPSMSVPESPYMRPATAKLVKIKREEGDGLNVWAAFQTKTVTEITDPTSEETSVFLPVIDPTTNACVAVMRVKARAPKKRIPEEDMDEVRRAATVFTSALDYVQKLRLGEGAGMRVLDAENIDENARRHLMFARMMLLDARLALSRLDVRAISELKSYKKPPLTVHKIIKAVLYLFGKTPKQVKVWADAVKDLLKQMIEYDPTALQKKIRFKRVKAVLKTIPHGDAKKRGSIPAMYMYDWLCVSVALRDEAVAARKVRNDVFTPESEGAAETGLGEEAEEEEEEMEDEASSMSTAKSIGGLDRAESLRELEDVSKDVPESAGHGPHAGMLKQGEFAPPGEAMGSMVVGPDEAEKAGGGSGTAIVWGSEGDGPPAAAQPDEGDRELAVRSGVGAHEVAFAEGSAEGTEKLAGPTNDASPVPIVPPPDPHDGM
ncbi:EF-hand calcium-binding domain-containing protein 5 [Rhizophlyctis rosea]|nr:EF-hand calcium-binding domain-containing protein 5 [Rhizophlyctis rosea]